jgi:hypothetical protein
MPAMRRLSRARIERTVRSGAGESTCTTVRATSAKISRGVNSSASGGHGA